MKIQRFEGESTRDALAKVQQALGEDAVILQTRSVRTPGVLRRQRVEVLAAVEATPSGAPKAAPLARPEPGAPAPLAPEQTVPARTSTTPPPGWQAEFAALRRELELMRGELSQALRRPALSGEPAGSVTAACLVERLKDELLTSSIQLKKTGPTTVALVGPTGSGKTTTLAKLAAVAACHEHKRVALITIDTYRIGALEQLESYARLMEVPVSRVYAPEDIPAARERYAGYDLIFIDTVGRSGFNTKQIAEQGELLEKLAVDEVHLCLDAGSSPATLRRSLEGFRLLHPTHLILSKVDESASLATTLETVLEAGIPLSYITTGQRVPEDLALVSAETLAERVLLGEE